MARREYAGAAAATTLSGGITASTTSIPITDATNWPTGSVGPFAVVLARGTANEEKVLVTSRSGTTLTCTLGNRGYDGTTAAAHASGVAVEVCATAVDFDEANSHVNATASGHAATAISFAPAGNIAATTVQAAIDELDSEKLATAGHATAVHTVAQPVAVKKAGVTTGTRKGVNFIEGSGVTITTADDAANDEVDVTIAASGLLAVTSYNPAVQEVKNTSSTSFADMDATNLAVTFTVPASGRVLVRATGRAYMSGAGDGFWNLRSGAADVSGTDQYMTNATSGLHLHYAAVVSGLTPGASVTYKLGHKVGASTINLAVGGASGQAVIEVWSA